MGDDADREFASAKIQTTALGEKRTIGYLRVQRGSAMSPHEAVELYRRELLGMKAQTPGTRGKRKYKAMLRALETYGADTLKAGDDTVAAWSDLHLGHANIIGYANRPFDNVDAMDAHLWASWEKNHGQQVIVCVGDFAMGRALNDDTAARIRGNPQRTTRLVVGNHDITGDGELRIKGFDAVHALLVSEGEPRLIWTHFPVQSIPEDHVNVHGHQHDTPPGRGRHINLSVEQTRYAPIALTRVRKLARALAKGEVPPGRTTIERIETLENK